jgi:hypothetical protein
MTALELKLNLPDEVLEYLQRDAKNRNIPLDDVVSEIVTEYLDEPTEEEILEDIRQSMKDVMAGNVRSIDDVLAELKEEFDFDAD